MDSPKCLECLDNGYIAQTYKVAGKMTFKCAGCKKMFHKSVFNVNDFLWKESPKSWLDHHGLGDLQIVDGKFKKPKKDNKNKK